MGTLTDLGGFFARHQRIIWTALYQHLYLTFLASVLSAVFGLFLGIVITRYRFLQKGVLGAVSFLYAVPALSIFFFLIPVLGLGVVPAIVTLFIYGLLPVVQNTFTGIEQVRPELKEAARGMGVTDRQLLFRVELPLAFPIIFAGLKNMLVINVAIATIAVFVGAGGLGAIIVQGIRTYNDVMTLAGTLVVTGLALLFEVSLGLVERRLNRGAARRV